MKKLAIVITAIALIGTPAFAADLNKPVYKGAPPPPRAPLWSWTGLYVGGTLGARWNDVDGSVSSILLGTPPVSQFSDAGNGFDSTAFRAGGFVGWNWQLSGPWVIGFEGDAGWTDTTASRNGSPYAANILTGTPTFPGPFPLAGSYSVRTTWDASARARAGWLATPTILLFATGGAAWLHLDATSNCETVFNPDISTCAPGNFFNGLLGPAVLNDSTTRTGWTVGGGIEALLGGNWLVRAEYRYADFGTANFTDVRTCTGCTPNPSQATPLVVSNSLRVVTQTAMVGLAYKFGP